MILSNQVRCNQCGDEPFSANTHDYRTCSCGNIAVDGGMSYLRRVGGENGYTDMSIEIPDRAYNAAIENIKWAGFPSVRWCSGRASRNQRDQATGRLH